LWRQRIEGTAVRVGEIKAIRDSSMLPTTIRCASSLARNLRAKAKPQQTQKHPALVGHASLRYAMHVLAFAAHSPLVPFHARGPALAPRCAAPRTAVPTAALSFGDAVEAALVKRHGEAAVSRVLDSFRAVRAGDAYETDPGGPLHRRATSYVAGLSDVPFLDLAAFPWAAALSARAGEIRAELEEAMRGGEEKLRERGTNVWVAAAREEALGYGPDWRTLVLQDREWDERNCGIFPVAAGLLREAGVPSVEAFFARQKCGSGIALHTDDCNFILTYHLGLEVEAGKAWIEVGGERRCWAEGEGMIFDTSFFHRTMNESEDVERVVLLVRFWHPGLTAAEREALGFIFRAIDDPGLVELEPEEEKKVAGGVEYRELKGRPISVVPAGSPVPRSMRRAQKKGERKRNGAGGKGGGGGFGR
jgi:Aspartyl/Asparaginyl beta-hydroxylase